jgi:hypothetical protein
VRYVSSITDGEIAVVQSNALRLAIIVKALDGGLYQSNATVVAELLDLLCEFVDVGEYYTVAVAGYDLQRV